jgi:KUP system potassium uptake protein
MPQAHSDVPAANGTNSAVNRAFWALTLGSIGVVYGDIGTSPLYALRIALEAATRGGPVTESSVLGVLSLIFWSLIVVVTLKYVLILLRADNNGEGGTLAFTALAFRALGKRTPLVIALGIVGASMFYGSTLITPALSVLSAVEGLHIATAAFGPYVLPLTVVILIALFAVQSRGTARVATYFAPVMIIWFIVIAVAGAVEIAANPAILAALNPVHGATFLASNGLVGLATLAAVFLVVTGSEALYNDLGHFGRKPIQTAWLYLVLPALLLNYFGQGALVLADPGTLRNPFFLLYPDWRSPPQPRRSPVRRSSPAPTRSRGRPCSSASCRAWRYAIPPRRLPGRSTCRA